MRESIAPAIAANRYGLGARPGELEAIASDPRGWLAAQLSGPPPLLAGPGLVPSRQVLAQVLELRRMRRAARADAALAQAKKLLELYRPVYVAEATARLAAAVASERPLLERLTQFWSNHFAVSVDKFLVLGLAGSFEREAIRPHVLGRFSELLLAVERHPAMLLYLDNAQSMGPNSALVRRVSSRRPDAKLGINENLAREILELHTLGVDGGYTQLDVTRFASVLSGWSIGGGFGRFADGEPGAFVFRPLLHEPGPQRLLGREYAQPGIEQGEAVLRELARSPATAHRVATQLAVHFIADDPPAHAIEHLRRVFLHSDGDLPSLYRALIELDEPWAMPLSKYKTPSEFVVSSYRALSQPVQQGRGGLAALEQLGQRTWSPGSPAGWPDRGADWNGASALLKRIEWAQALGARLGAQLDARALAPQLLGATLGEHTREAVAHAASGAQALTLLIASPEFLRR